MKPLTQSSNPTNAYSVPCVSIATARTGASAKANELGMRVMQERAYAKRGEQYLLIKSPPASGKSRALMFIALDKLHRQGVQHAIIVVPERSIGSSFANEPLTQHGFTHDWTVAPQWNLCNAPGADDVRVAARPGKSGSLRVLKTSCASMKPMAGPHGMGTRQQTSLSACTRFGSIACARCPRRCNCWPIGTHRDCYRALPRP